MKIRQYLASMAVITGLLGFALLPAAAAETAALEAACISLDFGTSAVIDANGSLWMWGWNNYGQLGNSTTTDAHAPVKVMDNVSQVVTGGSSTAALKTDGTLWKWGVGNSFGDRNYGNATALDGSRCQTVPVKVMDDVAKINSSGWCRAAVKTDGSLWTWYVYDESGGSAVDTPVKVLDNVASVTVERTNVMRMAAITEDSSLWIWGANEWGQVGNGTAGGYETTPVKVMEDVASVSLEDFYTVALKTDGSLWAWGNNAFSRLGTGSGEASYTPIKIMEDVRSFTADYSQNAAITEDDSLWVWGVYLSRRWYGESGFLPCPDQDYGRRKVCDDGRHGDNGGGQDRRFSLGLGRKFPWNGREWYDKPRLYAG